MQPRILLARRSLIRDRRRTVARITGRIDRTHASRDAGAGGALPARTHLIFATAGAGAAHVTSAGGRAIHRAARAKSLAFHVAGARAAQNVGGTRAGAVASHVTGSAGGAIHAARTGIYAFATDSAIQSGRTGRTVTTVLAGLAANLANFAIAGAAGFGAALLAVTRILFAPVGAVVVAGQIARAPAIEATTHAQAEHQSRNETSNPHLPIQYDL